MVVVALLALPAGIAAAIYLEEYAPDTLLSRTLNTVIRNLAGVPAVVYGILGLAFFVLVLGGFTGGRTVIAGGLTLAVLVLPIIIIVTAEALRAVPGEHPRGGLRRGRHALGGHPLARPALRRAGHPDRRHPDAGARLRRDRAAAARGRGRDGLRAACHRATILERLTGPYTALPTIIFSWSRQPNPEFKALTAAAIVVLLVVILHRQRPRHHPAQPLCPKVVTR